MHLFPPHYGGGTTPTAADIVSVHGDGDAAYDHGFDSVGGLFHRGKHYGSLGGVERRQYKRGGVFAMRRSTNTDPDADELGAHVGDERRNAAVAATAASLLYADRPASKIQVVVDRQQIGGREPHVKR
jgi:hypothetical protein